MMVLSILPSNFIIGSVVFRSLVFPNGCVSQSTKSKQGHHIINLGENQGL